MILPFFGSMARQNVEDSECFLCQQHYNEIKYYCQTCKKKLCMTCYMAHTVDHVAIHYDINEIPQSQIHKITPNSDSFQKYLSYFNKNSVYQFDFNMESCFIRLHFIEHFETYEFYLPLNVFPYSNIMMINIGYNLFFAPRSINVRGSALCKIDLRNFPSQVEQIQFLPHLTTGYLLCQSLGKYIYILAKDIAKKYDIQKGKIYELPKIMIAGDFICKPCIYVDRYLVILLENRKRFGQRDFIVSLYLDLLDESAGWKEKQLEDCQNYRDFFYNQKYMTMFGAEATFIKGSNKSLYFMDQCQEICEFKCDFSKNNDNISITQIIKGEPANTKNGQAGTAVYTKTKVWLLDLFRRHLISYSYREKTFKKVNSRKCFKRIRIVKENTRIKNKK